MYNDLRCMGGNIFKTKEGRENWKFATSNDLTLRYLFCGWHFKHTLTIFFLIFSKLKWPWGKHVGFQWFWKVCDSPYDSQICESYDSHIWEFLRITQFYFLRIMRIIYSRVIRNFANHANHMIRMIRVFANHANHRFAGFAKHVIRCE